MSLLDQVRSLPQQVIDRLKELEPLAREYDQLRKFAQRLGLNYSPDTANTDDDAQPTPTTRATPTKRVHGDASARADAIPLRASESSQAIVGPHASVHVERRPTEHARHPRHQPAHR